MSTDDESNMTEIMIHPDGRVFVFGMSQPVLEVLDLLETNDAELKRRSAHVLALGELKTAEPVRERSNE